VQNIYIKMSESITLYDCTTNKMFTVSVTTEDAERARTGIIFILIVFKFVKLECSIGIFDK